MAKPGPKSSKLTDEERKKWEKNLTAYAVDVSLALDGLLTLEKGITQTLSGTPFKIVDAGIRSVHAGLLKVYDILSDANDQVKAGHKPDDFSAEIPFPPRQQPLPRDPKHLPSWFQIAWDDIRDALSKLAEKVPKIAAFIAPIDAAGDELVKDLEEYFGGPSSVMFPERPAPLQ